MKKFIKYNFKEHGKIKIYKDLYEYTQLYPKIDNYKIENRGTDLRFALSTIYDYSKYLNVEIEDSFFMVIWSEETELNNDIPYVIDKSNMGEFLKNNIDILYHLLGTKKEIKNFVVDDIYKFLYLLYCHYEANIYNFRSAWESMIDRFVKEGFPQPSKEHILKLCEYLRSKNKTEQQRIAETDCTTWFGFSNSREFKR